MEQNVGFFLDFANVNKQIRMCNFSLDLFLCNFASTKSKSS